MEVNNDGSRQLHDLTKCIWNKATGDVICFDYNKSTNHALNMIKSYLDLAVKSTCGCLSSMTLVKHGQVKASRIHLSDHLNHLLVQKNCYCPWREANCGNFARLDCIIVEFNISLEEDRDILKEECGEMFPNLERFCELISLYAFDGKSSKSIHMPIFWSVSMTLTG